MKKIVSIGVVLTLALGMAACTQDQEPTEKNTEKVEDETVVKNEPIVKEEPVVVEEPKTESPLINTAAERDIEVLTSGNTTKEKATLQESTNGYNMYVLDGYVLEGEEPGRDVLLYSQDGTSFARIQRLDAAMDMKDIKESAMASASEMGEVFELDAKDLPYPYFYDAPFYVMASNDEEGTMSSLVKVVNGVPFKYTVHLSKNEKTEDISSAIWSMLTTVAPIETE